MADFDPYHEWLGISPEERPVNYYSLLSLRCFESNTRAISNAADRQMAFVRTFQTGPHSKESQEILNELSKARVTLLNPEKKRAYDAQLRKEQSARQVPLPPPIPPLKRPEPPVLPQPKRSEPMVQSVSKKPEPVVRLAPKRPEPTVQSVSKRPEPAVKPSSDQPIFSTQSFDPDVIPLHNAPEVYKETQNPAWEILKQVLLTENDHSVWKVKKEYGTQYYQTKYRYYTVNNFVLENVIIAFLNHHVFLGASFNYDEGDIYLTPSKVTFKNITENLISLGDSGAFEIVISKVYSIADHTQTKVHVVDWIWEHAKKNGDKDSRYKKNKKIHIVEYFKLSIYISNIKFGSYLFGNEHLARLFVSALLQKDPSSIQFKTNPVIVKREDCKKQTPSDEMSEMDYLSKMIEEEFVLRINGDDDYIYSQPVSPLSSTKKNEEKKRNRNNGKNSSFQNPHRRENAKSFSSAAANNNNNNTKKSDRYYGEYSSLQSSEHRGERENTEFFSFTNNNNFTKNKKLTDEEIANGCCGCFVLLIIFFLYIMLFCG